MRSTFRILSIAGIALFSLLGVEALATAKVHFKLAKKMRFAGGGYSQGWAKNHKACQNKCAKDKKCRSYTFQALPKGKTYRGMRGECTLNNKTGKPKAHPTSTYGIKCTPGKCGGKSSLKRFNVTNDMFLRGAGAAKVKKVSSLNACAAHCLKTKGCKAFEWRKGGTHRKSCWTFTRVTFVFPNGDKNESFIAFRKKYSPTRKFNITKDKFLRGTARIRVHKVPTLELCAHYCLILKTCKAFEWRKGGTHRRSCWTFTKVTKVFPNGDKNESFIGRIK